MKFKKTYRIEAYHDGEWELHAEYEDVAGGQLPWGEYPYVTAVKKYAEVYEELVSGEFYAEQVRLTSTEGNVITILISEDT